ncbi:cytochrome b/b6 domain-containing protein [Methanocella arvoryzae]|uniref:F420-nonreducing hydrogenase (Membrane-bound),cytochrome b subunit n=1 Tax=Methanocella arvoryzae (strain DSM 22066 / NBRC 105507 / MRE50) TaxID=351160 RepID=Q0W5V5_METAR|nr:cytochrome b/b6 domain-containing protein [Methanocella arvoryzae]CAJ36238.1 F420-nonreducing hydrogenase (membrane-bound),cytochrome b subunit [Methanocella arvoryzae MRE50]
MMEKEKPKAGNRMIVVRHTTLERLSHYANIVFLTALLLTGFCVYMGLPYLSYNDAFAIHVLSGAAFVAVNWIVVPYNAIVNGKLAEYWLWPSDIRRLARTLSSFFSGKESPRYTIYDEQGRRFINRLHPVTKLLIYSHYVALFIASFTGLVLYSTTLTVLDTNISGIVLKVLDFVAPTMSLSGLGLARLLHIAAAYWFIIETVIHVGMVQLDPRKFLHIKSMFLTGKEDLMQDSTAEIVNTKED